MNGVKVYDLGCSSSELVNKIRYSETAGFTNNQVTGALYLNHYYYIVPDENDNNISIVIDNSSNNVEWIKAISFFYLNLFFFYVIYIL